MQGAKCGKAKSFRSLGWRICLSFRSLEPTAANRFLAWRCSKNGLEETKKELCPFACSEAFFARNTRLPTEGGDKGGDEVRWQQMPKLARDSYQW